MPLTDSELNFIVKNRKKKTVNYFAELFSVSIPTIKRAITQLIKEGKLTDNRLGNAYYKIEGEIWKNVTIPEIKNIYCVSNLGRLYNKETKSLITDLDTDAILTKTVGNINKYNLVTLQLKDTTNRTRATYKLHRLVAIAFIPIPKKYLAAGLTYKDLTVNHIKGIKNDNRVSQLEWLLMNENLEHSVQTGLNDNSGISHPLVKHSEDIIHKICRLIKQGKTNIEIEAIINKEVNAKRISDIRNKRKWKCISKHYF